MPKTLERLPWAEFAAKYCARQEQTPEGLLAILRLQKLNYHLTGWVMLEVAYIGARNSGDLCIVPFGPNNTWKAIPTGPVSPRGLASDMSVVVAVLDESEVV